MFILPLAAMAVVFWLLGRDAPQVGPRPSVTAGISLFRREVMPRVLSLFYFLTFGGFVALGIYLPKLLVDLFGFTPTCAGLRGSWCWRLWYAPSVVGWQTASGVRERSRSSSRSSQ